MQDRVKVSGIVIRVGCTNNSRQQTRLPLPDLVNVNLVHADVRHLLLQGRQITRQQLGQYAAEYFIHIFPLNHLGRSTLLQRRRRLS